MVSCFRPFIQRPIQRVWVKLIFKMSFIQVTSDNMEGAEFIGFTEAIHQGAHPDLLSVPSLWSCLFVTRWFQGVNEAEGAELVL